MVVKLQKALYRCLGSAKLWYENFSGNLKELGFEVNPRDCLFFYVTGSSRVQLIRRRLVNHAREART